MGFGLHTCHIGPHSPYLNRRISGARGSMGSSIDVVLTWVQCRNPRSWRCSVRPPTKSAIGCPISRDGTVAHPQGGIRNCRSGPLFVINHLLSGSVIGRLSGRRTVAAFVAGVGASAPRMVCEIRTQDDDPAGLSGMRCPLPRKVPRSSLQMR